LRAQRRITLTRFAAVLVVATAVSVAGCGGDKSPDKPAPSKPASIDAQIAAAARVSTAEFPPVGGRTLRQIGDSVRQQGSVGLATSDLVPGKNRLAFGLLDPKTNGFIYGKSAVYVAPSPDAVAAGPYPAPADGISVAPQFRSKTNANTAGVRAIYSTTAQFTKPGRYFVLVVTKQGQGMTGAVTQIGVARSSRIPKVGERPPKVDTDTVASAGGDISKVDTRQPHDTMHTVNLRDVVGKRPVALLFATPQLCQSRVCGPVTDIEVAMQKTYGNRIAFIHQEVYVDNDLKKGLRPSLLAFNLRTEPWLFTFDRKGRIAARLEGAFGVNAFKQALEASLR
jgi:hypothetical protein